MKRVRLSVTTVSALAAPIYPAGVRVFEASVGELPISSTAMCSVGTGEGQ